MKSSKRDAKQSLKEERQAIEDYRKRGKRAEPKLKVIFRHAQREEKQHAKAFRGYLKMKAKA